MTTSDPLSGRWTLDLGLSEFSTPPPRAWDLLVDADALGMSVEERITRTDGTVLSVEFSPRFDGHDHPVTGSPIFDAAAFVRRDSRTLEATGKKESAITMRDTTVVDADGQILTISYEILVRGRVAATGRAVFLKQPND